MQRIIVKNFGPLKDIDLEIKDYMVFLGPQASGKSTLAKLIYGFKEVFGKACDEKLWKYNVDTNDVFSFVLNPTEWEDFLLSYFSVILQDYKNFTIQYCYKNNISVILSEENGIIKVKMNSLFVEKILKINDEVISGIQKIKEEYDYDLFTNTEHLEFIIYDKVSNKINQFISLTRLLFIPDERNINVNYHNSSYVSIVQRNRKFFNEGFLSVEKRFKNLIREFEEKKSNIIKKYFFKILKGDFENINNGKIVLPDFTKISLDVASSGQKEVIGILIVLTVKILEKRRDFYVIEEPEAHLFPEAQKDITYLISLLANQAGNQVIITTHSHYILGALNILINAHRIGQTNPEAVEKIIPRELWVDKNRIFAGFLENGEIKNIYDDEAEMIKIQQLNAVAGEINKDFDRLLDLEFTDEKV